jgi:hypothetical protein
MSWKNVLVPGVLFFVAGAVITPMGAFLIALYFGYKFAAEVVKGRQFLGFPPPEKIVIIGIYIGALLFAELFFALGMLTRLHIGTSLGL